jgi:hypothetical protein
MANFPDVLATSYASGSTPVVKAADLVAMQMEHVREWRALRGADFLIADDFLGDTLNRSIWLASSGLAIQPDVAAGALGSALIPASGSLTTQLLALGTLDFRLMVAMRFPNYAALTTATDLFIYLLNNGSNVIGFRIVRDPNVRNIQIAAYGASGWPALYPPGVDTGMPVPVATYGRLEIRRSGALWTFLINDVLVYSLTYAGSASDAFSFNIISDGAMQAQIDFFKLHVIRQPVSSATVAQVLGAHAESKTVTFNGTQDYVDLVWTNPFADNSYRLPAPGIFVSSGPLVISASYANKTPTGIRVVPSARFTGEVYVDAHE